MKFTVKDRGQLKLIILNNVLYVPSINRNLISVIKMEDAGLHAKLDGGIRIYSPRWKYLFTARRMNNFYVLKGIPEGKYRTEKELVSENWSFASDTNSLMQWHERYGHCNVNTLKEMFKKQMVIGLGELSGQEEVCEYCRLAKSTRSTHSRLEEIRSKDLLQLIHSDVWGPAPVESMKRYRYVLTFIDDFSRSFCYPLKTKEEVLPKFREFIAVAERQTNKKVRTLRTDNGLEFCSERVERFLRSLGIKHEHTTIYSPQMNGVAERYNTTLFDGVRAHLLTTNLPNYHWIEAVMATNYLRNRTLHSTIQDIPFCRWYGRKPNA